jgi:hypothetical protein
MITNAPSIPSRIRAIFLRPTRHPGEQFCASGADCGLCAIKVCSLGRNQMEV